MSSPPRHSALGLLLAEILFIFGSTWWPESGLAPGWGFVWYGVLFGMGGYRLSQSRRWLALFVPIAILALIANFIGNSIHGVLIRELSITAAQIILFWAIFQHSFIRENVPKADRILAGIAGYLLLGLLWTTQFSLFRDFGIDALVNSTTGEPVTPHETLYFSYITLTAVGYGEITPVTPGARTLTIFASLSGILYLAILISSLVSGSKK